MSVPSLGRQLVAPVGVAVVGITALAWYVSISTADSLMAFTMFSPFMFGATDVAVFYALMTTMMVAMMLPATLPMVLGYKGLLKANSEAVGGVTPNLGTLVFLAPYALVWGGFGVAALVGLAAIGVMGPMVGLQMLIPGLVLVAAGAYQVTSVKRVCLSQCQSPFTFVLGRFRKGLGGAFRMGLSHSKFCVGCCWMFMVALFVTGAVSLLWMGAVSVLIFVEKVGIGKAYVPRGIGIVLVVLGVALAAQAFLIK